MGDSNTPFLLTYDQSASASSRGAPSSPTVASPVASAQVITALKSDVAHSANRAGDDMNSIGARKRLLEERVFGPGSAAVASSFPVNASDIIKLVQASSPSAPTFGSVFHTPAGGIHVSALPPLSASPSLPSNTISSENHVISSKLSSSAAAPASPSLCAALEGKASISTAAIQIPSLVHVSLGSPSLLPELSVKNKPNLLPAPSPVVGAAATSASAVVTSAPSVEPEREELQLSEDESEFPATSPENSRSSMPHTTPDNGSSRVRKRKSDEKTPQKSPPKAARITNWFSRQNGSASQRRSHGDLDSSMKTFDAFVQTDDDASRAVIAAYKKAAEDAEIARKFAEESGARLLQELGHQERSRREALEASHEAQLSRYRNELQDRIRKECALQRESARDGLHADLVTVGRPVMQRASGSFVEVWEEGSAFRDLQRRLDQLQVTRDDLEKSKRERAAAAKKRGKVTSEDTESLAAQMPPPMEVVGQEQDEIWKLQAQAIKREETAIAEEKERLESRRASVIREFKRIRDEDRSRFNRFQTMAGRYVLMNLLGKGGFSEVYKAYDLVELRTVALKIHELNAQWSEEKKANYMRHATRESSIQKTLENCRVVRLYDVFELSADCFCTVLEFCEGSDLDLVLKMNKFLPEREARSIIVQVVSALRYLNMQKNRIIHYDLKPANVLIHRGEVKITDFGLSKVMSEEEHEGGGMELTSQGAGTYWYLPPECFEGGRGRDAPRISSKVDVWSVGIMFYQMLFGMKPFGDGMSQEKMLQEGTMLRAASAGLTFPTNPKVSQEAKDFIKRCLARVDQRPDVLALYTDSYVRNKSRDAVAIADSK